jgi:YHS domain-containing protein
MKKIKALFTLTAAALLLAGCASTGSTPSQGSSASRGKAKPYPLDTCIVTDNELGSMGTPLTKVYDGQTVKFCCKPCVKEFEAEPAKFLPKINKS